MKRIISILIFSISFFSFSQEVEKISKNTKIKQTVFYVLKSDMSTKHGKYTVTSNSIVRGKDGKAIMVEGYYKYGKKDGLWTTKYFISRGKIQSQGNYKDDIQIGVWKFYDIKGKLVQEYDFDSNKILFTNECGSEEIYDVYIEDKFMKAKLDCPPSYIGGYKFLKFEINEQISTSFNFDRKKEGGTIKIDSQVSFYLKENGTIENIEFRHSIKNEKLKKFIKNLLEERQSKLIVAELNDSKVCAKMKIPIYINIIY